MNDTHAVRDGVARFLRRYWASARGATLTENGSPGSAFLRDADELIAMVREETPQAAADRAWAVVADPENFGWTVTRLNLRTAVRAEIAAATAPSTPDAKSNPSKFRTLK